MNRSDRIARLTADLPNLFGPDYDAARQTLGRLCAAANVASLSRPGRIVGGVR